MVRAVLVRRPGRQTRWLSKIGTPWCFPTAAVYGQSDPGTNPDFERDGEDIARSRRFLFIVEKTVEAHVSSCLGKLGLRSRTQVARWAPNRGLIIPEELRRRG
ncbi:MAG TPA: LuxR C-terminal-related transcriptional regulator [Candidatus Dormibacteraeota bacterium]